LKQVMDLEALRVAEEGPELGGFLFHVHALVLAGVGLDVVEVFARFDSVHALRDVLRANEDD